MGFNEKDIVYTRAVTVAGFAAGSGTSTRKDSTWDGSVGSTSYTIGDLVSALKIMGVLIV